MTMGTFNLKRHRENADALDRTIVDTVYLLSAVAAVNKIGAHTVMTGGTGPGMPDGTGNTSRQLVEAGSIDSETPSIAAKPGAVEGLTCGGTSHGQESVSSTGVNLLWNIAQRRPVENITDYDIEVQD